MEQQPARNSSASVFAGMLAQNIVALLEELDQVKAELAQTRAELRTELLQRQESTAA